MGSRPLALVVALLCACETGSDDPGAAHGETTTSWPAYELSLRQIVAASSDVPSDELVNVGMRGLHGRVPAGAPGRPLPESPDDLVPVFAMRSREVIAVYGGGVGVLKLEEIEAVRSQEDFDRLIAARAPIEVPCDGPEEDIDDACIVYPPDG
jgi:hypothetical protein